MKSILKAANLVDWALGLGLLAAALYYQSWWLAAGGGISLLVAYFRVTERVSNRVQASIAGKQRPDSPTTQALDLGIEDEDEELTHVADAPESHDYRRNPPRPAYIRLAPSRHNELHPTAFQFKVVDRPLQRWF